MLLIIYIGGGLGVLLLIIFCCFVLKWLLKGTGRESEEFNELEQEQLMDSVKGLSKADLEEMISGKK